MSNKSGDKVEPLVEPQVEEVEEPVEEGGEEEGPLDPGAFPGQNPSQPIVLEPDLGEVDRQAQVEGRAVKAEEPDDKRSAEERQEEADKIAEDLWKENHPDDEGA